VRWLATWTPTAGSVRMRRQLIKLATRDNGERDGCLVVVSHDLTLMADAADIAPTLQQALELAPRVWPALQARYQALNARRYPAAQPYDP
ncbi:hypothetical protein QIG23_27230, partial [Klebsiella pneumoniae]|nr:hypothetical protein [Klebsiella pneumoniae]